MKKIDKNIHKVLLDNEADYIIDSELENSIMRTLGEQKYSLILMKAKRKVRMGLTVSLVFLLFFIAIIYFELFTSDVYDQFNLTAFYPSIFSVIAVVLVYFEMILGISVLKRPSIDT